MPYFETEKENTQQHGGNAKLCKRDNRQHRCTPFFYTPDNRPAQHTMPEAPQQETALLPFPQATKNVLRLHGAVAVLPCIFVFKIMVSKNVINATDNTYYADRFQQKSTFRKA